MSRLRDVSLRLCNEGPRLVAPDSLTKFWIPWKKVRARFCSAFVHGRICLMPLLVLAGPRSICTQALEDVHLNQKMPTSGSNDSTARHPCMVLSTNIFVEAQVSRSRVVTSWRVRRHIMSQNRFRSSDLRGVFPSRWISVPIRTAAPEQRIMSFSHLLSVIGLTGTCRCRTGSIGRLKGSSMHSSGSAWGRSPSILCSASFSLCSMRKASNAVTASRHCLRTRKGT
mmetsp:Transcript_3948/g.6997  ORF Transcript_3948/g.6997 Transcript_3948/m.6997 type:complete len:226 (-) Transcript_3948:287-964(-)